MEKQTILDTTCLIDILRGNTELVGLFQKRELAICAITVTELYQFSGSITQINELVELFQIHPITSQIAKIAGLIRRNLRKSGQDLDIADCIIAATAVYHKKELITKNVKHFTRIKSLQISSYI